jgi:hypothetical protein
MKHYLILFSLLVLAAISGCKKDKKCPNVSITYLEQEMKDWIYFDSGSYWIYIDSVTGAYDSVYVTKSVIEIAEFLDKKVSNCVQKRTEAMNIYLESSNNKSLILNGAYGRDGGVTNNMNPVSGSVTISNQKYSGGDGGYSHYMYFPVLQGTVGRWTGFGIIKHDTIYAEYEVHGTKFQNVLQVHDNYNMALGYNTKFYHAKNIGVIRKEYYEIDRDNPNPKLLQVWELAEYKVSQ